jgi:type IV secretion system protein VirB9
MSSPRRLACAFSVAALIAAGGASASVTPRPGPGDPRIQNVEYDAQQVVVLSVALNYALTLEFSPDERIQNVAVGNAAAWQVTASKSADRLFIKPIQGFVDTDMTVVTDTRTYAFELKALPGPDPRMAYMVRFDYPVAPQAPAAISPNPEESVVYAFGGARGLWPSSMSDDGRSTTIVWPDGAEYPAVSYIDANGQELLANGVVRDGRYVVDQVSNRFIFRVGGKTAFASRSVKKAHEK